MVESGFEPRQSDSRVPTQHCVVGKRGKAGDLAT